MRWTDRAFSHVLVDYRRVLAVWLLELSAKDVTDTEVAELVVGGEIFAWFDFLAPGPPRTKMTFQSLDIASKVETLLGIRGDFNSW
jgi:hypothetical protein